MLFPAADGVIKNAIEAIKILDNQRRKEDAVKRLDFFHDEQLDHIQAALSEHFSHPEKLNPLFVNIVKKIVRQLAMVYIRPAVRELDGNDADQEIFNEIAKTAQLDIRMKMANRYAKLLKTVMVRPVWRRGKMELDILTPEYIDVVTGDSPEDIRAVIVTQYKDAKRQDEIQFIVWTDSEIKTLDWRYHETKSEPNPYGMIPHVAVWDRPPTDEFWLTGGDDLITAQEAINQRLTDLMYVLRQQGFGVGYTKGLRAETDLLDPGVMVNLPVDGDIGFVKPEAPIEDALKSIEFIVKQTAIANGISASSVSSEVSEESGVARIVGNRELEEMRADDIELFTAYESRLFDVFRAVWNAHNPGRKISDAAKFNIDFYDVKPTYAPNEQAAAWMLLIDAGVMSVVDAAQAINPDLRTRDAAIEYLQTVKEENAAFYQSADYPALPGVKQGAIQ